VRTDRVKKPADLKGRKVGVPEYQLTANVWARALLDDDYGVKPADIHWIRAASRKPGRPEKLKLNLPAGVRLDNAPEGTTISALIESGEIDGFIAPRPPT
jgi:4,5-dihydroxyphthalate decarboxylase